MGRKRRKRRNSKELDPPNMSGDSARENVQVKTESSSDKEEPERKKQRENSEEETERREDEEELEGLGRENEEKLRRAMVQKLKMENEKLKMENEKLKMENEKLKREQTERPKREEEERPKREEEEKQKREQEERLKREQEEKLKREQEERLKREQAERLKREQEEKLKREQEEKLKREQEEKLKREQEEKLKREKEAKLKREKRLRSARELEMKKIQEFVQQFPDQQIKIESAVEELNNIADNICNDRDALVDGTPAINLIRRGAAIGAGGVVAGAALGLLAGGAGLAVCAAAAGAGAAIARKGASALNEYNKKLEDIRENASSRMTELGRSAATAIAALLNLKRLSGLRTAADPDYEKVFEMLKTDSGLRDLTERMEELLGASGTDKLADSEIDKIAESVFPNDLKALLSLFSIILSFNIQDQKNEKASKICECAEKLEQNLQAVTVIHTAMKPLDNCKLSSVSPAFVVKEEAQSCR